MGKFKDNLLDTLGGVGLILYFIVSLFVTILPLLMFDMPFWLYIVLSLIIQYVVIHIPFGMEALYIVGLFGAIHGEQNFFAILYYIVFAIVIIPTTIRLIMMIFTE